MSIFKKKNKHKGLPFQFHVDEVSGFGIRGWAWRPARPEDRVVIEVRHNGVKIGEVIAKEFRNDLKMSGIGDGSYGFVFIFPQSHFNDKVHIFQLHIHGSEKPFYVTAPIYLERFEYHIDTYNDSEIAGWAWLPNHKDWRPNLEFLEAGIVIGNCRAALYRDDLKVAGKGDGEHGFYFQLPPSVRDNNTHRISIRIKGSDHPFCQLDERMIPALEYHIDSYGHWGVSGWLWLPFKPSERVQLEFLDGKTLLGQTTCDHFREDLRAAHKGDGAHGFRFAFPAHIFDDQEHEISLRLKGDQQAFHALQPTRLPRKGEPGTTNQFLLVDEENLRASSVDSDRWSTFSQRKDAGQKYQARVQKSKFDITIVLNVHREAMFLQRTLLSLIEAVRYARHVDALSFELIVVLDNSDSQTIQWVERAELNAFDDAKIVPVSNGSLALSRNTGIAVSNGKYISACDADDLISYNMFSQLYRTIQNYGDRTAVFPEFLLAFGDTCHLWRYYDSFHIPTTAYFDYHPFTSRIFMCAEYMKSHPYEHADHKVGYAYEDWWYNTQLVADDFNLCVAPNTTLYYRQRSGSLLRDANVSSQRIIRHSKLFRPDKFLQKTAMAAAVMPSGRWESPSLEDVRSRFFDNPIAEMSAYYANKIDPAIQFRPEILDAIGTNLHADAKRGIAYRKVCEQMRFQEYKDIILVPYLTSGGAEKYILNLLFALAESMRASNFLFLIGQRFDKHTWLDRVPENSDILNLYEICSGDTEMIDLIAFRLIECFSANLRVHLKACDFAHRFLKKFGNLLPEIEFIYYRFSNSCYFHRGHMWIDGNAFNAFSDILPNLKRIISDHKLIVEADSRIFGFRSDLWNCIYTKCSTPEKLWELPPQSQPKKLLWASRIAFEKRPELVVALGKLLEANGSEFVIDIFGNVDLGQNIRLFDSVDALNYRGTFSDFFSLELNSYHAFVYTSHFDGLPNVVLEAMASAMPVIAPKVGGISEVIEDGVTGWLVETAGDDEADALAYMECLTRLAVSPEILQSVGRAARLKVQSQHGEKAFNARVKKLFSPFQSLGGEN